MLDAIKFHDTVIFTDPQVIAADANKAASIYLAIPNVIASLFAAIHAGQTVHGSVHLVLRNVRITVITVFAPEIAVIFVNLVKKSVAGSVLITNVQILAVIHVTDRDVTNHAR